MKRFVAGLLTAVLALAMLTACSSDNIKNPEDAVKEHPTDPVEMVLYSRVQQACKELNREELIYSKELSEIVQEDARLVAEKTDKKLAYADEVMEKVTKREIEMNEAVALISKQQSEVDKEYSPLEQANAEKVNSMQTVHGVMTAKMSDYVDLPTVDEIKGLLQIHSKARYFGVAYKEQTKNDAIVAKIWFM